MWAWAKWRNIAHPDLWEDRWMPGSQAQLCLWVLHPSKTNRGICSGRINFLELRKFSLSQAAWREVII